VLPQPEVLQGCLNHDMWEILVKWMGQAAVDATWEKVPEFTDAYPSFQLEDELFHNGRGSVVDAFTGNTYQRWQKIKLKE
jgi:hypothetical protein